MKQRLEKELKILTRELRVDLPQEIKKALAMGDLRENAEYHAALERQNFVKSRIGQIKRRLQDLSLMKLDKIPTDRVALGSKVFLEDLDSGKEIFYEIVMEGESDPAKGMISLRSPIAKSLIGKKKGDEVTVTIPSGIKNFEILKLVTVHNSDD
jgi:transcription elongation factor GreA